MRRRGGRVRAVGHRCGDGLAQDADLRTAHTATRHGQLSLPHCEARGSAPAYASSRTAVCGSGSSSAAAAAQLHRWRRHCGRKKRALVSPASSPASSVARRCGSRKYAGTVMTALVTGCPKASAAERSVARTTCGAPRGEGVGTGHRAEGRRRGSQGKARAKGGAGGRRGRENGTEGKGRVRGRVRFRRASAEISSGRRRHSRAGQSSRTPPSSERTTADTRGYGWIRADTGAFGRG